MRGVIVGVICGSSTEEVHLQQAMARLSPFSTLSGSQLIHQMHDGGSWFGG